MSDEMIRLQIVAEGDSATTTVEGISTSVKQLNVSLNETGVAGRNAGAAITEGMEKAEFSTTEARHAAHLLGEEIGVRVPRALQSVMAESSTLGPILSAAFSTVAVVGFVELAKQAGEKLSEWASSTFIFTEAQKEMDKELRNSNADMEKMNEHIKALNLQMELMGKSGSAKTAILMGLKEEDISKTVEKIRELQDQISPLTGRVTQGSQEWIGYSNELAVARKHLEELTAEQGVLSASFDTQKLKEHEAELRKEAEYTKKLQEEFKQFGEELARASAKATRELERLATEHGNLIVEFKELAAVDTSEVIPTINEETRALLAQQAARERIAQGLEGTFNHVISLQTLMTRGWKGFADEAVKSFDEIGLAMLQHLAVAMLVDDQLKLQHARTAASAAYAAEAGVPIVGPILAPIAATAAFAGALAFKQGGIVPSAAGGMITEASGPESGTLALLHPNEMVLPAPISQTVQDMASSAGGRSGAGIHIENVHAMDSQSFDGFLSKHSSVLGKNMHRATNQGHFNMTKAARGK